MSEPEPLDSEETEQIFNENKKTPVPDGVSLKEGEDILWYGKPTPKSFTRAGFLCFLYGVACPMWAELYFMGLVLIFFTFLYIGLYCWTHEFALTTERVITRKGIIARKVNQSNLTKVTDVRFKQGPIQRLLRCGSVSFDTAGGQQQMVTWEGIENPEEKRNKASIALEKHKENRRKEDRIERLKDQLAVGEITKEEFDQAKKRIESEEQVNPH